MAMDNVFFFMKDRALLDDLSAIDVERDWGYFSTGVKCWSSQTFLRLRAQGYDVKAGNHPPQAGVVCCHADDLHALINHPSCSDHLLIACARADREPQLYADYEIVQNQWSSNDVRCRFIPHWPQPGLRRRSPERRALRCVGYKGEEGNLHPWFLADEWGGFLKENGLSWDLDTTAWSGSEASHHSRWNDYSSIDVFLSIRKDFQGGYYHKPASKLVNSWQAGVPAILGSEVAYLELRKSPLDYIHAQSPEHVKEALLSLMRNPQLYSNMVENGLKRAEEFTAEKVTNRWVQVFSELAIIQRSRLWQVYARMPRGVRMRIRRRFARGIVKNNRERLVTDVTR
ncbi:glycosyltransferase [Ectothiorhodospira variabilis]|uniref:glycosyltransferase n=1 Tax=Ectothiorhodospira variabilis TaxID=505694 RepID=UPI001EFADF2E|nr:hypothetical protein [Ectothiorhodospira variabilis]MCG5497541.1 hypothetical protein [Ectothiorhodospira variabilis]